MNRSPLELIDIRPDFDVQESEYKRLLGYPANHELGDRARELAAQTREWYSQHGAPWIYAREADAFELSDAALLVNGTNFESRSLRDQLEAAGAHGTVLVAVSAGRECEEQARQLWQEGKPDEYFFMEMYGSAIVEHLITRTGGRICDWAERNGMTVLPHYSPGYSGWQIIDQVRLWELIRRNGPDTFARDLQVLDTGMLRPKKSLLALFGITRHRDRVRNFRSLVPCQNCSLPACPYRRAPYENALPQIEDVRLLRGDGAIAIAMGTANGAAAATNYSIAPRALQKWSRERLRLETLPDGSTSARFRYEGTTCANLGQPLEFHYDLKLDSARNGYRILEARCAPAPNDVGHQAMCEYLNDANALMNRIAEEKPLLGRPLEDVLHWKREFSPSGCYCDRAGRDHKWGLVLEVVHYALTQNQHSSNGESKSQRNQSNHHHDKTL